MSSILSTYNALKYKDLGILTNSCIIRDHIIKHALLDLSTNVSFLPYLVYQKPSLGKLKQASSIIFLTIRSIKTLKGIIKDVFV